MINVSVLISPKLINETEKDIMDEITTDPYQDFAIYFTRVNIRKYHITVTYRTVMYVNPFQTENAHNPLLTPIIPLCSPLMLLSLIPPFFAYIYALLHINVCVFPKLRSHILPLIWVLNFAFLYFQHLVTPICIFFPKTKCFFVISSFGC